MSHPIRPSRLPAGQQLLHHVPSGTTVVVREGSVLLTLPPVELGGQLVRHSRRLLAGEACCVEAAGWLCVQAQGTRPAVLTLQMPPSTWQRLARLLRRVAKGRQPQARAHLART